MMINFASLLSIATLSLHLVHATPIPGISTEGSASRLEASSTSLNDQPGDWETPVASETVSDDDERATGSFQQFDSNVVGKVAGHLSLIDLFSLKQALGKGIELPKPTVLQLFGSAKPNQKLSYDTQYALYKFCTEGYTVHSISYRDKMYSKALSHLPKYYQALSDCLNNVDKEFNKRPGYPNIASNSGQTALGMAILAHEPNVIDVLLSRDVDPDFYGPTESPAIISATNTGQLAIVQLLLDHGAQVDQVDPYTGNTALMAGVSASSFYHNRRGQTSNPVMECGKLLLSRGADIRPQNHWGETALSIATAIGQREWIDLLYRHS